MPASAQRMSALRGNVLVDSIESPIKGAEIQLSGSRLRAISDSAGAFKLIGIASGRQLVTVRRLGFHPVTAVLNFPAGDTLESDFLLVPSATRLSGVNVTTKKLTPGMADFERRRTAGFGRFITPEQLDKMNGRQMVEVLAVIPGPVLVRSNVTSAAWVAGGRGQQSVGGFALDRADKAKGAPGNKCWAAVYLNGANVFGGQPGEALFDINTLPVEQIAGIEFYNGAGSMPVEFNATRNTCGALIIWLK